MAREAQAAAIQAPPPRPEVQMEPQTNAPEDPIGPLIDAGASTRACSPATRAQSATGCAASRCAHSAAFDAAFI